MTRQVKFAIAVQTLAIVAVLTALIFAAPTLPDFPEVRARWNPSYAQLLDRNGQPIEELRIDRHGRRLAWTPLDQIAPPVVEAVIAGEDHRFARHHGVDFAALASAAAGRIAGRHSRGASTITMQLAAMLDPDLARISRRRGLIQKLRQIRDAFILERRWSKDQILEAYLNLVKWRGELVGIRGASRVMFARQPHGLTSAQALVLASMLRGPNARAEVLIRRANRLRNTIRAAPPPDEIAAAVTEAVRSPRRKLATIDDAPHLAPYLLRNGTFPARCTLDGNLQRFASHALNQRVAEVHDRSADSGAVLVVDNRSGEVWAYVGNAGVTSPSPYVDAVRASRQPGSALKPFLYALAIDRRILTASSLLEDSPLELNEERGAYRPMDYDRHFRGLVSLRTALGSSLNVPAVRTAATVGVEQFAQSLRTLGFEEIVESGDFYGSAIAVGSADVKLWELVNAYRTLVNGGEWTSLAIGPQRTTSERRRIFGPEAAYIISDILADRAGRSATFGLENALATRYWSAVKTGTSKDMRDNWCVGYTDRFTVGVWVGNSSGAPMRDVSGITGAAPVWLEVMDYLHDRFGSSAIKRPSGVVERTADLAPSGEPPRTELFISGTEPDGPARMASARPRIESPADGTIIALDPDIPSNRQRILLRSSESRGDLRWRLDSRDLDSARTALMWLPLPGEHRLTLIDDRANVLDAITFVVRGRKDDGDQNLPDPGNGTD